MLVIGIDRYTILSHYLRQSTSGQSPAYLETITVDLDTKNKNQMFFVEANILPRAAIENKK